MEIAQRLGNEFSGPLIFDYMWWTLREAHRRGISRLYFLARDGYTLRKVAEQLCNRFGLEIECRYLYCSRKALRTPSWFFIGDEAYEQLFLWGYHVTLKTLLSRGGLTGEERAAVYRECGLRPVDEERPLDRREFDGYAAQIKKSSTFRRSIDRRSRSAYGDTVGYLRQEGLFEQEVVAVVDSGWTGSMQRSLRQLLEFAGYRGKIVGFYFGLYEYPRSAADGEYATWYFNAGGRVRDKVPFCNNLFECLLAAPHGMTAGYRKTEQGYEPVLLPPPRGQELRWIEEQSDVVCRWCSEHGEQIAFDSFDAAARHRDAVCRIKRYMSRPTREEAAYYGSFQFCDDITEAYRMALASEEQRTLLREYSFLRRILRKLTKRSLGGRKAELFWPYGTIAFLNGKKREWYRLNVITWELLKQIIRLR